MLGILSLLVTARILLFVIDREWLTLFVKIVLALVLLRMLGKIISFLSYS